MTAKIVTFGAHKGGVGKTTNAYEVAAARNAILVDFDHQGGGVSRRWGYDIATCRHQQLIKSLERGPDGPPPKVLHRQYQPSIVPGHIDLTTLNLTPEYIQECLESWAAQWDTELVIVDTPGGHNPLQVGAMLAADAIVVPVELHQLELSAIDLMLSEYQDYPIILLPNKVATRPSRRLTEDFKKIVDKHGRDHFVAPIVSEFRPLRDQRKTRAVVLDPRPGTGWRARAAQEFRSVADYIGDVLAHQSTQIVELTGSRQEVPTHV